MMFPTPWPALWAGAGLSGDRFPIMRTLFAFVWMAGFALFSLVYWRCGVETRSCHSPLGAGQRSFFP
jgi:hypothetical protein